MSLLLHRIKKYKISNTTYTLKQSCDGYEKTKSYPNRYPISSDSIGIKVVGKYDDKNKKIPKCHNKAIGKPRTACCNFA